MSTRGNLCNERVEKRRVILCLNVDEGKNRFLFCFRYFRRSKKKKERKRDSKRSKFVGHSWYEYV